MDIGKWWGVIILVAIASFWTGRPTKGPEVRTEMIRTEPDRIYSLPACLEAVCRSIYLAPACEKDK